MRTLQEGYQSFSFLLSLNWDRILYLFTVFFALCFGAFIGSL